jgi:hypothetical protein
MSTLRRHIGAGLHCTSRPTDARPSRFADADPGCADQGGSRDCCINRRGEACLQSVPVLKQGPIHISSQASFSGFFSMSNQESTALSIIAPHISIGHSGSYLVTMTRTEAGFVPICSAEVDNQGTMCGQLSWVMGPVIYNTANVHLVTSYD